MSGVVRLYEHGGPVVLRYESEFVGEPAGRHATDAHPLIEETTISTTHVLAVPKPGAPLEPSTIELRPLRPDDVLIDIAYCGICHTDIHLAREEWGTAIFPMVPGHEITGVVAAVGSEVTGHRVGDRVGVGCMVDSCGECEHCLTGFEHCCAKDSVLRHRR
jgi:uncharacterized zinc-type alcohol dehydrogenase-like protein